MGQFSTGLQPCWFDECGLPDCHEIGQANIFIKLIL